MSKTFDQFANSSLQTSIGTSLGLLGAGVSSSLLGSCLDLNDFRTLVVNLSLGFFDLVLKT